MKIRRIKTLAIRKYKTVNALSPNSMKTILPHKKNYRFRPFDLQVMWSEKPHATRTKNMECTP